MSAHEEQHVAHPRLYGAPAYARPPMMITPSVLPPDPDDLPVAALQTPEEREVAERLMARPYQVAEARTFEAAEAPASPKREPGLRPGPLRLSAIAGKFLLRAS